MCHLHVSCAKVSIFLACGPNAQAHAALSTLTPQVFSQFTCRVRCRDCPEPCKPPLHDFLGISLIIEMCWAPFVIGGGLWNLAAPRSWYRGGWATLFVLVQFFSCLSAFHAVYPHLPLQQDRTQHVLMFQNTSQLVLMFQNTSQDCQNFRQCPFVVCSFVWKSSLCSWIIEQLWFVCLLVGFMMMMMIHLWENDTEQSVCSKCENRNKSWRSCPRRWSHSVDRTKGWTRCVLLSEELRRTF